MAVNLQKGQKISLSKDSNGNDTNLETVVVGLGWDAVKRGFFRGGNSIDCDASAILLKNGYLVSKSDVVYFGSLNHPSGAVNHCGDNLTGDGDGDDEQIVIDLPRVPIDYDRIVIAVNIYNAERKKQDFGMIANAFIRLVDAKTNTELMRYNLSDNYEGKTAMIFGELYRHNGEWKFNAVGQGTNHGSITEVAASYKKRN